jgi:hypothetical protein
MRTRIVAILAVSAGLSLAGCAGPGPIGGATDGPGSASSNGFSGPWADLFELTYSQATTEEERAALADGVISAQEYAYFQDQIVQCLGDLNIAAHFNDDKNLEYSNPDQVPQDEIADCNAENGIRVITLKDTIDRNPTHLDENELVVDCLQRVGLVDGTYTSRDLANGVDIAEIGQTEGFSGCTTDPVGYGRG